MSHRVIPQVGERYFSVDYPNGLFEVTRISDSFEHVYFRILVDGKVFEEDGPVLEIFKFNRLLEGKDIHRISLQESVITSLRPEIKEALRASFERNKEAYEYLRNNGD